MNTEQNEKTIKAFQDFHNYLDLDCRTPFKVFSLFGSLVIGFTTAFFAPEFTSNFINHQYLTLSMVVIGFYLATTVTSLKYKNQITKLVKEHESDITEKEKSQFNFVNLFWFYYIEMGPMLTFVQSWVFIVLREISDSTFWNYFWSSLVIWSFFALITLLFRRYLFIDKLLQTDNVINLK